MRISRTTVLLLVANLVAFGLVWRATSSHRAAAETPDLVFTAAGDRIELTDEGRTLTLERRNSIWRVTAPFDWAANIWTVQRLQDELRFISLDQGFPVENGGEGLATYGLAKPRWTLKVTGEAGSVTEAKVGLMPNTRKGFLLTEDRRRIIPLSEAMVAALEAKPEDYRVDKVFEISDFEARAVSVRRGPDDEVFALVSETRPRVGVAAAGPEWRFESPFDTLADAEATPKAVAALTNLRVARFLEAAETDTGLAAPGLRIALEGSARRQALLIGRPIDAKGDLRYAKLEDNPTTFVVDGAALAVWSRAVPQFLSTRPAGFDPALVTGLTLAHQGRSLTLRRLDAAAGGTRWEIPVVPGSTATKRREADRADGKVLGEARLAPNGSWTGSGRLDAATARRVAETMAEVTAAEFPTRDLGAGDWKYELRVTDQAAAGAGGAAESLRTYLLAAPLGAHNLLMRDEADSDPFLLAPARADILIPLLDAAGK
jgi:hypothetical protein